MENPFHRDNYALMRHACYHQHGKEVRIDEVNAQMCCENIRELVRRTKQHKFVLHSSPEKRATLTRDIVAEELQRLGYEVSLPEPTAWLGPHSQSLTAQNLDLLINQEDDTFYLFIAHKPEIADFLGTEDNVVHCGIFMSKDQMIR